VIHLDDGSHIVFRDPRKFGRMRLAEKDDSVIAVLGPEPLEDDFTISVFKERLSQRKGPIKAVLLDQAVIAGIGNMYADEALFASRIHPLRSASGLSDAELERLYKAIREVLVNAISAKGASVNTYMRPDGQRGTAHRVFKVAHRRGENCPDCGGPIERQVVRGRGSYFCPKCQVV
jgi:formamidopyrimidine-DNA glycosylase